MRAVAATPRAPQSARLVDVPDPPCSAGEVLVRVLECGLCATDCDIDAGRAGESAVPGQPLILGHEVLGRVAATGSGVVGLGPGDLVVATVRRPCGCSNCDASEIDMCQSEAAPERGIRRRHGFLAEYFVEQPAFLVRVPRTLRAIAVLLEPLSVAEKAVFQVQAVQRRMRWQPERALILGADTIALLAAMLLRAQGLEVAVCTEERTDSLAARWLADLGVGRIPRTGLPGMTARFDLILDRAGRDAALAARVLGPGGVLCCVEQPLHAAVRGNQVAIASAGAHLRDYERGVGHLAEFEARWPGLCARLVTRRLPLDEFRQALGPAPEHIKTVISLA